MKRFVIKPCSQEVFAERYDVYDTHQKRFDLVNVDYRTALVFTYEANFRHTLLTSLSDRYTWQPRFGVGKFK